MEELDSNPNVVNGDIELAEQGDSATVNYQASSPDEVRNFNCHRSLTPMQTNTYP